MKRIAILLIAFFIVNIKVCAEEPVFAKNAKSSILIEQSTGKILYENNSHEKLAPASMTKMMSLLIIMESIENKMISLDQKIIISLNASKMGGSQILLEEGEEMTVNDLLKGITIASGNDAVVALAEAIAGSEENFVKMMNQKLKKLGLKDSNFKNCHGLDEEGHYSSAYDMAFIARELVNHKKILEYSKIYETYLRENTDRKIWLVNTNKLVRFKPGVDGLKTGYTKEAGYCLTATMKKNNMRVIATVMNEPSSNIRNKEVSELLDYSFSNYRLNKLITKETVLKKVDELILKNEVEIIPVKDVNVVTSKMDKKVAPKYKIQLKKLKNNMKKGDIVGNVIILNDGKVIDSVDVALSEDYKKNNIFELYLKYLMKIFSLNMI